MQFQFLIYINTLLCILLEEIHLLHRVAVVYRAEVSSFVHSVAILKKRRIQRYKATSEYDYPKRFIFLKY